MSDNQRSKLARELRGLRIYTTHINNIHRKYRVCNVTRKSANAQLLVISCIIYCDVEQHFYRWGLNNTERCLKSFLWLNIISCLEVIASYLWGITCAIDDSRAKCIVSQEDNLFGLFRLSCNIFKLIATDWPMKTKFQRLHKISMVILWYLERRGNVRFGLVKFRMFELIFFCFFHFIYSAKIHLRSAKWRNSYQWTWRVGGGGYYCLRLLLQGLGLL